MINKILGWVLEVNKDPDITFLHGNNAYPTPFADANLGQIKRLIEFQNSGNFFKSKFKVGLSDHTEGILVPPLAVAMGATTIEKHYTISRDLEGPDHKFAIEPNELISMIENIRTTEETLNIKVGKFTDSEKKFFNATRSVVCKRNIQKGEVLTENNITTMRPALEDSIPAIEFYETLNKQANRSIEAGSVMFREDVEQ
jgi:N,N'-diacetyllegionaminate synthase